MRKLDAVSIWTPVEEPRTRSRGSWLFDAAVALAAFAASLLYVTASPRLSTGTAVLIEVLLAAPLLFRRMWPVPVFTAQLIVAAATGWWAMQVVWSPALLIGCYTVAVVRPRRDGLIAAGLLSIGAVVSSVHVFGSSWLPSAAALVAAVITVTVLGLYFRARRELLDQLRDRARYLERERDQQATIAAATERTRIAREMHDVIAHHLTVMVTLSEGAAAQAVSTPERAGEVMRTVSDTGRRALADTRRLLGVLRDASGGPALAPQPGVGDLVELIDRVRAAGLSVRYDADGSPPDAAEVQLAVYRVVQEALTNTMRHSGPGTAADVQIRYGVDDVTIEVTDDGAGVRLSAPVAGGGRGLAGLRERVEALGGELVSGPSTPRGWQVSGRIKVADA
jgi:signal transduction histidine kinase